MWKNICSINFFINLFIIFYLLFISSSSAAVLSWDAVEQTKTCVVAGYKIHYGTMFGQYPQILDVGDVTFWDLDLLGLVPNQRYFLAVSAYSTTNLDGPLSISVSYTKYTDSDISYTYYRDYDNDGYGDPSYARGTATKPSGYVSDNTDCNDYDRSIHPGATEIRGDEIDQDCNGSDLLSIDSTVFLTDTTEYTIPVASNIKIYGTSGANNIILQSGAKAKLFNFPGNNTIIIQSDTNVFSVYRSGAMVTFYGTDGTLLSIPATSTTQSIVFNDKGLSLKIDSGSVMLGSQVVGTTSAAIE